MTTRLTLDSYTGLLSRDYTDADGDHSHSEPVGDVADPWTGYVIHDHERSAFEALRARWEAAS